MTISSTNCKATYTTASAVTNYAYNFKIFHAAQLSVTVVNAATLGTVDLILALDYGVSGVGEEAGGAVQLTASGRAKAGTGNKLVILRAMDFTQETDYRAHDVFPAETHERALDILTMMCQELKETLSRAIIRNPDEDESIPYHEIVAVVENVEAYKVAAQAAAALASTKADEAKQAATEAKTARTQAQTAQGKAEAAQGASEAARDQTQAYATEGKGYRDQASTYTNDALAYRNQAQDARDQADAYVSNANSYMAGALAYRNQAQSFANDANNSAVAAQTAKDQAETARDQSQAVADTVEALAQESTDKVNQIKNLSASATTLAPGDQATASYDQATGLLTLGLPKGDTGERGGAGPEGKQGVPGEQGRPGDKGDPGEPGKDGTGVSILDYYDDVSELPPSGTPGDGYMVGENLYVWSGASSVWKDAGPIRGPEGKQGEPGARGEPGAKGETGEQGDPGPPGTAGANGAPGTAATIKVGAVTTGAAGSNAAVTNVGTLAEAVFNFTIPRGATGATGATGSPGANGAPGAAATIRVGTVTTGAAGSNATVTNAGTAAAAIFNFSIPKGDKGDSGVPGLPGSDAIGSYGTCATAAATVAKVGVISKFVRYTGAIVGLKFTNANTAANPTLNVNGTGAAAIYYQGAAITAEMIPAGHVALFQFNGTQWELLNPAGSGGGLSNMQIFTSSGTWVVPEDLVAILILIGGGGGGGAGGASSNSSYYGGWGGSGGGGGGAIYSVRLRAGLSVGITVGAGGIGRALGTFGNGGGGGGETVVSVEDLRFTAGGGGGGGGGLVAMSNQNFFWFSSGGGGGGGGWSFAGGDGTDGGNNSSSPSGDGGQCVYRSIAYSNGEVSPSDTVATYRQYAGGGPGGVGSAAAQAAFGSLDGQPGPYSTGGSQSVRKNQNVTSYSNQNVPGVCLLAPCLGNANYGQGGRGGNGQYATTLAAAAGESGNPGCVGIFY